MAGIDTDMIAGFIPILLGIAIVVVFLLPAIRARKRKRDFVPVEWDQLAEVGPITDGAKSILGFDLNEVIAEQQKDMNRKDKRKIMRWFILKIQWFIVKLTMIAGVAYIIWLFSGKIESSLTAAIGLGPFIWLLGRGMELYYTNKDVPSMPTPTKPTTEFVPPHWDDDEMFRYWDPSSPYFEDI